MLREEKDLYTLQTVKAGSVLNRGEESHSLRVYLPNASRTCQLLESLEKVQYVATGRVSLRYLKGLGGALTGLNEEERHEFDVRCYDAGPVRVFVHSMMGKPAQLCLLKEIDPNDTDRAVVLWLRDAPKNRTGIRVLSASPKSTKRTWLLDTESGEVPLAVGLAFKGLLSGAWWDLERIEAFFTQVEPNVTDFACLRWFRAPILDETKFQATRERCKQSPVKLLNAWRNNAGLPTGLYFNPSEDTSLVPRSLLWEHRFAIPSCGECFDAVSRCAKSDKPEACVKRFGLFMHLSLGLFHQLAKKCLKQCPHKCGAIRTLFLQEQLGVAPNSPENLLGRRLRECRDRSAHDAGVETGGIEDAFNAWVSGTKVDPTSSANLTFLALGRTLQGRKYLGCSLIKRVLAKA